MPHGQNQGSILNISGKAREKQSLHGMTERSLNELFKVGTSVQTAYHWDCGNSAGVVTESLGNAVLGAQKDPCNNEGFLILNKHR